MRLTIQLMYPTVLYSQTMNTHLPMIFLLATHHDADIDTLIVVNVVDSINILGEV